MTLFAGLIADFKPKWSSILLDSPAHDIDLPAKQKGQVMNHQSFTSQLTIEGSVLCYETCQWVSYDASILEYQGIFSHSKHMIILFHFDWAVPGILVQNSIAEILLTCHIYVFMFSGCCNDSLYKRTRVCDNSEKWSETSSIHTEQPWVHETQGGCQTQANPHKTM